MISVGLCIPQSGGIRGYEGDVPSKAFMKCTKRPIERTYENNSYAGWAFGGCKVSEAGGGGGGGEVNRNSVGGET